MTSTDGAAARQAAAPSVAVKGIGAMLKGIGALVVLGFLAVGATSVDLTSRDGTESAAAPSGRTVAREWTPDRSAARPGTSAPAADATPAAPPPASLLPVVPVRDASLAALQLAPADAAEPVRLIVPAVQIDMPVRPVGVREDGQMAVPDDANAAGWYEFGPSPGSAAGTAVIAAHVDSWETGAGPFAKLRYEVTPGTRVVVGLADGTSREYEVVDSTMIPKPEMPLDAIFERQGPPRLVLVTCGGRFQRDVGRYTDNVVVTAVPVGGER